MSNATVIIMRVVPHYRVPLLTRLHEEFGWIVATSANPPGGTAMKLESELPFAKTFDFRFPNPKKPQRCLVPVSQILDATKAENVIAEFGLGISSTWELAARRRLGRGPKLLYWGHGYNPHVGIETTYQHMRNWPMPWLLAAADGAITYAEYGRDYLQSYLPSKKVFVAHNTIDISKPRALAQTAKPAESKGSPNLICVCRLAASKRVVELVEVFKRFRQHFPDASLTLIGAGPEKEKLTEAAGAELDKSVFLTGAIYDEAELARHFLAADAFVACGGVGLSVNHAFAYGLPIVCFARTSEGPEHGAEVDYVVDGQTGKLVRPYNSDGMLDALVEFFSHDISPRERFSEGITKMLDGTLDLENYVNDFRAVNDFIETDLRQ